jgi:hypothetical protein
MVIFFWIQTVVKSVLPRPLIPLPKVATAENQKLEPKVYCEGEPCNCCIKPPGCPYCLGKPYLSINNYTVFYLFARYLKCNQFFFVLFFIYQSHGYLHPSVNNGTSLFPMAKSPAYYFLLFLSFCL